MKNYTNEELKYKFNIIESTENRTVFETALEGWEEDPITNDLEDVFKKVIISAEFTNQGLELKYKVDDNEQTKIYDVPSNCLKLRAVPLGITENEVLDIDFDTDGTNEVFLHLRYGDDYQIDNEIIELIGDDQECEVYGDSEGYWLIEDIYE